MPTSAEQTNAHYTRLFSRFTADVRDGSLDVESQILAYELRQIPGIGDSGIVLDAGCGTGRYAVAWRVLYPSARIVGVDINQAILRAGLVRPDALIPVNGDLEALPFKSASFDVVMSRGVIQHTANPSRALQELLRVCKPGGIVCFYTYRHGWYDVVLAALRRMAGGIGAPLCARMVYFISRILRLDPRAPTMILDELFVPIRLTFSEQTIREWLCSSGIPVAWVRPVEHAQFGSLRLSVDRRTAWLYRLAPKNQLIALAVGIRSSQPVRHGGGPADTGD